MIKEKIVLGKMIINSKLLLNLQLYLLVEILDAMKTLMSLFLHYIPKKTKSTNINLEIILTHNR